MTIDDWITIHNYVPYAARLERYRHPYGTFWQAYKKLRQKYGSKLAIRFDYVESTEGRHNVMGTAGKGDSVPLAQPVLRIGSPHLFASRAPNIRKQIRNVQKNKNRAGSY